MAKNGKITPVDTFPAKPVTPNVVAPVVPAMPEVLKIDEISLLKLTRFAAKERAARIESVMASSALNSMFQDWVKGNEQAKQISDKLVALQKEQKDATDGYMALVEKLGTDLKIDMKQYAFDEDSGVLHPLPANTEVESPPAQA